MRDRTERRLDPTSRQAALQLGQGQVGRLRDGSSRTEACSSRSAEQRSPPIAAAANEPRVLSRTRQPSRSSYGSRIRPGSGRGWTTERPGGGIEAGSGRRGSRARAARDHELGGGADQPREDAEADDIWSHQARPAAHPGAGGVTATPAPQTRESPKVGQTSIGVDNHDRTWCGNG